MKKVIHKERNEVLGRISSKQQQTPNWINEELEEIRKRKKELYQKWLTTQDAEHAIFYITGVPMNANKNNLN